MKESTNKPEESIDLNAAEVEQVSGGNQSLVGEIQAMYRQLTASDTKGNHALY
jgi:hypothetical protein